MKRQFVFFNCLALFVLLAFVFTLLGCDDDSSSDSEQASDDDSSPADDDDTSGDDDTSPADDDDTSPDDDDDTSPADDDDTSDDDDSTADDDDNDDDDTDTYIASWPQEAALARDYDETGDPGERREKAMAYDEWHRTWHQPDYGGNVHAYFADETYTEVTGYHGHGDSCIWTGVYLGSQSMRYWVTNEAQARTNAIDMVQTLDGFLRVTGRPGFIARYRGSQDGNSYYQGDEWCELPENDRCHHIEEGDFAGDFWIGGTSRDQYTGWFYGMTMAYDHLDDEATRQIIRDDMTEVLDELLSTDWWITDVNGLPTDAGPNVLPTMQLSWLLAGYHVTGEERFRTALQELIKNSYRTSLMLSSIGFYNRYAEYYGNNLAHVNWFNILRLGKLYLGEDDYLFLLEMFENQVHTFTRLSHNPWFTAIFMGVGDYTPVTDDPYQAQLEDDLSAFRQPPLGEWLQPAKDPSTYTLDPVSVFLHDLFEELPWLGELLGEVDYQALEAFTVDLQCPAGFMFQWSPFTIDECGSDTPTKVYSGHDYLAAYWMASYQKFITKGQ